MASPLLKILVLGDIGSGKATLVQSYLTSIGYMPPYSKQIRIAQIELANSIYRAAIYNTSGLEKIDLERSIHYLDTDAVILCFPVDSHEALLSIKTKWIPELQRNCYSAQIVLLGTKSDLRRENPGFHYVSLREGLQMSKRIGAYAYLECAAINNSGVWPIFQIAVQAIVDKIKETNINESISQTSGDDESISQTSGDDITDWRQESSDSFQDVEALIEDQTQYEPVPGNGRQQSCETFQEPTKSTNKQKKKHHCMVS